MAASGSARSRLVMRGHEAKLHAAIDLYLRECENQRAQIAMVYREYR